MTRLGFYTGKLYGSDEDISKIGECCLCLSDKEAKELVSSEEALRITSARLKVKCYNCNACPEANKSVFLCHVDLAN